MCQVLEHSLSTRLKRREACFRRPLLFCLYLLKDGFALIFFVEDEIVHVDDVVIGGS